MRKSVGEYSVEGIDMNNMHDRAMQFMELHQKEYRQLTTYDKSLDLNKLFDMILSENKDLGEKADPKTTTKIQVIMEELFNQSMAEAWVKFKGDKENPEQRIAFMRATVNNRCDWMEKAIYLPFFKAVDLSDKEVNPQGFTAEELAHVYVQTIREGQLAEATAIANGAHIDVGVGTMKIVGERGFTVANGDKIKDHSIYVAKDYSKALETGTPPMDYLIARILRHSHNAAEYGNGEQFLNSPIALKLVLLGTKENNPMLAYALGVDKYEKLLECYSQKPAKVTEGSKEAISALMTLSEQLRDAQTGKRSSRIMVDGKTYESFVYNGVRFGIRTEALATGVYARCMNPTSMYDDSIIAMRQEEKPVMVNNMAVYGARTTQSLATEYRNNPLVLGAAAAVPLKFNNPSSSTPPAPPGKETPPPNPGNKGGVGVDPKNPPGNGGYTRWNGGQTAGSGADPGSTHQNSSGGSDNGTGSSQDNGG